MEKVGVISYNIRICSEICWICSPKIPKRHIMMPSHNTAKNSKFSRGSMPMDPPSNASNEMISKIQLYMGLWKKLGLSLVISEYALRRFCLLTKIPKKTHQMTPNSTKISKFFPGKHAPGPLARFRVYRVCLRTFHAQKFSLPPL